MLDQRAVPASIEVATSGVGPRVSRAGPVVALRDTVVSEAGTIIDLTSRLAAGELTSPGVTGMAGGIVEIELETRVARHAAVSPPGRPFLALKRAVDIVGASAALLILGPFLLGVAALIAIVDGRPVLFRQPRAGLRERPFTIIKFRTMRAGADEERAALRAHNEVAGAASFKMTNDPRTSRLGRILRSTSIDEFPQFINVLRGDMSLVGPRPHPFDDLEGYQPWHHARFAMKPGVTGLWQVSSRRDPDFDRWVELDLQYIRHWSPTLDIEIMARTIPAMIRGEGR